ncbi:MAG TPA: glycosyltransferase family 4 protein [Candidatus Paceibacterota bacterium]|jgi:glycosyltransferase involved in cell wall biosynthesis|nr:glycosyltransferase family 4 protein [Candidatus Paceibacterota bacterium]
MEKKKVLFVITKSNWGGAQRYVFDLVTNLDRARFEPVVALGGTGLADAKPGLLKERLEAAGVRTTLVQSFMRDISISKELGALRELIALYKRERPDVVHLNSSKAGGLGALAARLAGVPKIIFTSHGLAWDEDRNIVSKALIYVSTRLTFVLCHKVITITRGTYKRARACLLCRKKIVLIHNGISPIQLMLREEARAALQIPQDALAIGALGELTWNKGYHLLLRAAQILKRDGKKFYLIVMGDGDERAFLETLIQEEQLADCVRLAGFVQDGAKYLKAFDIFALSSVKEGLPYVLMEAGQAGVAVVATNVGGVSDIIGDSISGLLAKPKNEHDLAKKLQMLIDDPGLRQKFGEALQKRVEQEFSIAKMVAETQEIY